jgi:adenine-specific DNA-methyltransferase
MMETHDVTLGACRLIHGTAEAVLPTLPDASVQLILTDPPYFRTKLMHMGERVEWDRQWKTREAYLAWLRQLALEWRRVLTPNGSLYCFASPQMAAHVEVMLGDIFHVIQRLTWRKPPFATKAEMFDKDAIRMFFPVSEAIIFAEQAHADTMTLGTSGYAAQCEHLHGHGFESLRSYLEGERQRANIDRTACNTACGFAATPGAMASRKYFSASQWQLPTQHHYATLQALFNREGRQPAPPFLDYHPVNSPFLRWHTAPHHYEYLRTNYEDLCRPFTLAQSMPYTDVLDFATVRAEPGKHECEKPVPLLRHLILVSSRPGDTVLDCTMGRGSTLDAARQCGRRAIGIEQDIRWWRAACRRLSQEELFTVQTVEEQRHQPTAETWQRAHHGGDGALVCIDDEI